MEKDNSNKLVLYNTLSTIILYAVTFFSAPLFSRMLGTDNYGIVQVYNTWVSFFAVILGIYTRGTLPIAKVNFDDDEFTRYQSSVLALSIVGFVSISLIVVAFQSIVVKFFGLSLPYLMLMLAHSFGTYCVFFLNTKFTYEMKAKNNLFISVTIAVINFGFSYLLVRFVPFRHLYTGRILGVSIPYIVAGMLVIIYVLRSGKTLYNKAYWKFCLPLCLPLVFHGISGIICSSGDRVMIQQMIGVTAVGVYALAYNFANIMDSIWGALHNSWDPFFYEFVKNDQLDMLKDRSRNYIRLYTCLSAGFILLAPEVYRVFASEEYWEGINVIPIVVMSAYFIFIYAFAANYEFCFKRTDIVAIGTVIAGISNVILNIVFINLMGYFGAAIATLLSNIILTVVHTIFAKRLVKEKWIYSINMFILPVALLIFVTALFYLFDEMWIVRWSVAAAIGIYMVYRIVRQRRIF